MRNKVAPQSRHFAEQLLLRNFPAYTREHFYFARRKRFETLAARHGDINLDWDRLRLCKDLRSGRACGMPRTCPYCYVRYLLKFVWRPLQSVCCEIYVREVDGDQDFESFSHGLKHAAFGCAWTRRWTIGKNNRLVDSAAFITPTGACTLSAQEEKFLSVFAVPADFLGAPVADYAEVIRRNLQHHKSGKLGIMRKGQNARINGVRRRLAPNQILLPSLKELSFDLYALLCDEGDLRQTPASVVGERQPAPEFSQAVSPPPLPVAWMDFLRHTYLGLIRLAGISIPYEQFYHSAIPMMYAFARRYAFTPEDTRWQACANYFLCHHTAFNNSVAEFFAREIAANYPLTPA